MSPSPRRRSLRIEPLTPRRWKDFEQLFGPRGACAGCWCQFPRLTRAQFDAGQGSPNKRRMKRRVLAGQVPGLLAYWGKQPVGWCAIEPRDEYPMLDRSRVAAAVDDTPVWSLVCFFVHKDHRGKGVTRRLIKGALRHAKEHGARWVEAYPVDPKGKQYAPAFAWHGMVSAFEATGFFEVARRSPTRPVMRRAVPAR